LRQEVDLMDRRQKVAVGVLLVLGALAWVAVGGYVLTRSSPQTSSSSATAQQGDQAGGSDTEGQEGGKEARGRVNGTVTAIAGSTLTVRAAAGKSRTVVVTDATTYKVHGHAAGTLSDVSVGSRIRADGRVSGGVLTADLVKVRG
jgi:hypothetical protein